MSPKQICNDELLTLYHYQELTATESRSLEHHLAECLSCRIALDELRSSLAAVPNPELKFSSAQKQQFSKKITSRLGQPQRHSLSRWGTGLAVATALGVMVLMLRPVSLPVAPPPAASALAELEVLEQFELLKDLDLLQNLELLEELG